MMRLSRISMVNGPAALPGYDPAAYGRGIVHLGPGAFHRAHQAAITDAALAADGGDWRITGISLRSGAVARAMNAQNGLYTLIERGAGGVSARVIAAIDRVIATDTAAALAALADPAVRVVTLTVTEKGYGIDRATGGPDLRHPAVAHDLAHPDVPEGTLGLLVAALSRRRGAGMPPFTALSCDNLPENGRLLRGGVTGFARRIDPALADWIDAEVAFPSSMVDRITPAPTPDTLAEAERQTGCTDLAAVETEPFLQWVVEDDFPHGRPRWEAGGALFVKDVTPYERMKLTMLNGSHSMLAYAGFLSGHRFVRDAMGDPALARLVARHLSGAAALLPALPGIDLANYAGALLERFRNPAIAHETRQIAMDGTEKLPQRIFQPALLALERGHDPAPFAFATAAWMRHALGVTDDGERYPLHDPRADRIGEALARVPREAGAIMEALQGLPGVVPPALAAAPAWRDAVRTRLARMLAAGMPAAIAEEVA